MSFIWFWAWVLVLGRRFYKSFWVGGSTNPLGQPGSPAGLRDPSNEKLVSTAEVSLKIGAWAPKDFRDFRKVGDL